VDDIVKLGLAYVVIGMIGATATIALEILARKISRALRRR